MTNNTNLFPPYEEFRKLNEDKRKNSLNESLIMKTSEIIKNLRKEEEAHPYSEDPEAEYRELFYATDSLDQFFVSVEKGVTEIDLDNLETAKAVYFEIKSAANYDFPGKLSILSQNLIYITETNNRLVSRYVITKEQLQEIIKQLQKYLK